LPPLFSNASTSATRKITDRPTLTRGGNRFAATNRSMVRGVTRRRATTSFFVRLNNPDAGMISVGTVVSWFEPVSPQFAAEMLRVAADHSPPCPGSINLGAPLRLSRTLLASAAHVSYFDEQGNPTHFLSCVNIDLNFITTRNDRLRHLERILFARDHRK
jgi:hypothetical protein